MSAGRKKAGATGLAMLLLIPLVIAATRAEGFRETKVDLNDAGVWVVNLADKRIGRINTQLGVIEVVAPITFETFDVEQLDADVVVSMPDDGLVDRIDVATALPTGAAEVPAGTSVEFGGTTGALVNRAAGSLWMSDRDTVTRINVAETEPISVGADAAVAVDVYGVAHGFSPSTGEIRSVSLGGEVEATAVDGEFDEPQISSVGGEPVLLDRATGTLRLPGGDTVDVSEHGDGAALQQPGPSREEVLVSTDDRLLSISLSDGTIGVLTEVGTGSSARPVWLGGCAYGAWSGDPLMSVQICDDREPGIYDLSSFDTTMVPGDALSFRVNRDRVVLNQAGRGGNLLFTDADPIPVHDWTEADPALDEEEEVPDEEEQTDLECTEDLSDPRPEPIEAGTRPDRPTIIRVIDRLDDAFDPCDIPIVRVDDPPDADVASVDVVENGSAIQVTPAPGRTEPISFTYGLASASGDPPIESQITVRVVATGEQSPPDLEVDETTVAPGGIVRHNVLINDVDPDGDALTLVGVLPAADGDVGGQFNYRADGEITFRAGTSPGSYELTYLVRDEDPDPSIEPVEGILTVKVVGSDDNQPPVVRDDRVTAVVGQTIVADLIDNDSDPEDDVLSLSTVEAIGSSSGLQIELDSDSGELRLTAEDAGTWRLAYAVTDGEHTRQGRVRVDAAEEAENAPPIAVRDDVVARAGVPAVVDLVANDLDPDGDVLGVVSIAPPEEGDVAVEVVDLHIARITAPPGFDEAVAVQYTVSDGSGEDQGVLVVRPYRDMGVDQPPLVANDTIAVRAGNATRIPVLENDTDPEGERIALINPETPFDPSDLPEGERADAPATEGENGHGFDLAEDGSEGFLFVYGDELRYEAAPGESATVRSSYSVSDPAGNESTADLTINVRPADPEVNGAPRIPTLEARVVEGNTVVIPVPLIGLDPDGDTVILRGVDPSGLPRKGHAVQLADGFEYTADRGASGGDEFLFNVVDDFGKPAVGRVELVVLPRPGANSNPVAVLDRVFVEQGELVDVPVLANDRDPDGDVPTILPGDVGSPDGPSAPSGDQGTVIPDGEGRFVTYDADGVDVDEPTEISFSYGIADGRGGSARGLVIVTVTPDEPPNQVPIARDDFVVVNAPGTEVTVDVLQNDTDPDGTFEDLEVVIDTPGTEATMSPAGKLEVTVESSTVVRYQITDRGGEGRSAWAFVVIPVLTDLPPSCGVTEVEVDAGVSISVPVLEQCEENGGGALELVEALENRGGDVSLDGNSVVFTADANPSGDAGFAFVVSNGSTETVGGVVVKVAGQNFPPEFTDTTIELPAGAERVLDLAALVSDRNDEDAGTHTFSLDGGQTDKVSASLQGTRLTVRAADDGRNATATLEITVSDGADEINPTIAVVVLKHDKPLPLAVDDTAETDEDQLVTIPVTSNDVDQAGLGLEVVSIEGLPGNVGTASAPGTGQTIEFTPARGWHGTAVFTYTIGDGAEDVERQSSATVRVTVYGKPDAPLPPTGAEFQASNLVAIRWVAPANNGAPIARYDIQRRDAGGGGTTSMTSTQTSYNDTTVTNGRDYEYQVRGVNRAGDGEWSEWSDTMRPDEVPDAPAAPTLEFLDHAVNVTWVDPPEQDRSGTVEYEIRAAGGLVTLNPETVPAGTLSHDFPNLVNGTRYTFSVRARNEAEANGGWGEWSAGSEESPAGLPFEVQGVAANRLDENTAVGRALRVTWTQLQGDQVNAEFLDEYIVEWRNTQSVSQGPPEGSATVAAGLAEYKAYNLDNGEDYVFTVRGVNKAGEGPNGTSNTARPAAKPSRISPTPSATPGAEINGQTARVTFSMPADGGEGLTKVEYSVNNGTWLLASGLNLSVDAGTSVSFTIGSLANGGSHTIELRACNVVACADESSQSNPVVPYGAPGAPTVTASVDNQTINWSWTQPASNGASIARYERQLDSASWQVHGTSRSYGQNFGQYADPHTLSVRAVNTGTAGDKTGPAGSDSATTVDPPPPPPPTQTVTIWKGPAYSGSDCDTAPCAYISVSMTGITGPYTLSCQSNSGSGWGVFWSGAVTNPNNVCRFGFPGHQVRVQVNGVTSNTITW